MVFILGTVNCVSKWKSKSVNETHEVAQECRNYFSQKSCIGLIGPLGSGKTTFLKGVIKTLNGDPRTVRSPTFTLVREYTACEIPVIHADLYRVENSHQQHTVGLDEYFGRMLVFVEWANYWDFEWPEQTITIKFEHHDRTQRSIKLFEETPRSVANE